MALVQRILLNLTNIIIINYELIHLYKTGLREMGEAVCFCKLSEIIFSKKLKRIPT